MAYDSVRQYAQALSGRYDDWHPPSMARLWSLFATAGWTGAGPMLAVQLAGWWLGFGLVGAALWRQGRRAAALAIAAVAVWPPFVGWQATILKDGQALAALLAATGLVGWWRLRGRAVPTAAWAVVAVLLGYAAMVRANAMFAVAPLAAGLPERIGRRTRCAIVAAVVIATMALSPVVNHGVLGAAASGVEKTQPLYDLAGIAMRAGAAGTGFTPGEVAALRTRHCVQPLFWDPLGEPAGCGDVTERLLTHPSGSLYRQLARAVVAHPAAYAAHRAAHLNATWRWCVPAGWPGAAPPQESEPNRLGLGDPGPGARRWQTVAERLADLPVDWPVTGIAVAAMVLAAGWARSDAAAALARALLASALGLEASFAVVSIASDLRYHLWPLVATAVALVLTGRQGWSRRSAVAAVSAMAVLWGVGIVARGTLPPPPARYEDWMRWPGN